METLKSSTPLVLLFIVALGIIISFGMAALMLGIFKVLNLGKNDTAAKMTPPAVPAAPAALPMAPAVAAPIAITNDTGISEEHLNVVIATAVSIALEGLRPAANIQVTPADLAWANEGRRDIFHSRALNTRK